MPTTTNFGWTTPADTDLVKDGASAMRTLGNGIDTSLVYLKGGTTGQILSKTSNTDLAFTWINNDQGDLTAITAGTGISVTSGTGPIPTVAIDTATTVDKTTAQTLTNKTIDASLNTLTNVALSTATTGTLGETRGGTNQTTYTTGDLLYASASNTLAKRGIGTTGQVLTVSGGVPTWATASSGSTFAGCQLYKTSSQSVSDNTNTTISFEAEFFDSDNYHDNTTNNSRITIPSGKAGKYFVFASLGMDANTTGRRLVYIFKNGATYSNGIENALAPISSNNGSTLTMGIVDLAVGDYVTAVFYQNSGGSLNVTSTSGSGYTRFGAFLIGA